MPFRFSASDRNKLKCSVLMLTGVLCCSVSFDSKKCELLFMILFLFFFLLFFFLKKRKVLEVGIVVHSVITGISLGASESPKTVKPLVTALSFHQFFEDMGLAGCISQVSLSSSSFSFSSNIDICLWFPICDITRNRIVSSSNVLKKPHHVSANIMSQESLVSQHGRAIMTPIKTYDWLYLWLVWSWALIESSTSQDSIKARPGLGTGSVLIKFQLLWYHDQLILKHLSQPLEQYSMG